MIRIILLNLSLALCSSHAFAQNTDVLPSRNETLLKHITSLQKDPKISVDSAWSLLSSWNHYPVIKLTNRYYLFLYNDSIFGTVPLKVFIPGDYRNDVPSPAILMLHGEVGGSSFKDAYKDKKDEDDLFQNYFESRNFIIIRPFADGYNAKADGTINFDWVVNRFNNNKVTGRKSRTQTNPTFETLTSVISQLKQILNINDNKVIAFGHSDGADGVFALDVYKPSPFAGFIAYNSMLTNLDAYDIYLRNTKNRPFYLVHSDLDDLRPIQQTRLTMKILDSLYSQVLYKEYIGYEHWDKHLQQDLPYSFDWGKEISRNPFQKSIIWETSDLTNRGCDWLRVTQIDTMAVAAPWHMELNSLWYNKRTKGYMQDDLYYRLNKSGAVTVSYNNNIFNISTSRIKGVELMLSPVMVNFENPVVVKINGKEVFNRKVKPDKGFLLESFKSTFDRKSLWSTSIIITTE